jgi:peptidoglycan hydrolase CwlO-like protein
MEDIYLKIITGLVGMLIALVGIIYRSIIKSIEKNDDKINKIFDRLEQSFENKFRSLEMDVKENNQKIKEIIARQDTEMQLINKQISLLDSEIKYLTRRLNRIEGLDSDHY